jgi:hypothetical protein
LVAHVTRHGVLTAAAADVSPHRNRRTNHAGTTQLDKDEALDFAPQQALTKAIAWIEEIPWTPPYDTHLKGRREILDRLYALQAAFFTMQVDDGGG